MPEVAKRARDRSCRRCTCRRLTRPAFPGRIARAVSPGALTASPVGVTSVSAECPGRTLRYAMTFRAADHAGDVAPPGVGNANRRASGNRHAEQRGQGPGWRGVGDFASIGRPRQRGERLNGEDALKRAAIGVDDPDAACVSPTRHEGDLRAVRRPGRPLVDGDAGGHLPWIRAIEPRRPDVSAAAANGGERDSVPTWRDDRVGIAGGPFGDECHLGGPSRSS